MSEKQAKTDEKSEFVKRRRPARRAILEVARRLLLRDGSDALTPEAVAKESGLSLEIVYTYFCNKDELLLSIASGELSTLARTGKGGDKTEKKAADEMGILKLPEMVETFINERAGAAPEADTDAAANAAKDGSPTEKVSANEKTKKLVQSQAPTAAPKAKTGQAQETAESAKKAQVATMPREAPRARRKPDSPREIDGIVKELTKSEQAGEAGIPASVARLERRVYVIERNLAEEGEKPSGEKAESSEFSSEDVAQLVQRIGALEKQIRDMSDSAHATRQSTSDRLRILEATPPAGPSFAKDVPGPFEPAIALVEKVPSEDEQDPRDGKNGGGEQSLETFLTAAREAAKSAVEEANASDLDEKNSTLARWKQKARELLERTTNLDKKTLLTRVVPIPVVLVGLALTTWTAMSAGENLESAPLDISVAGPGTVLAIETSGPSQIVNARLDALMAAAEAGNADAQTVLGLSYLNAEGVNADAGEAARVLQLAAESGQAIAQYTLATLYAQANGPMSDPIAAKFWFQSAAEQGNRMAMNNLAMFYAQGLGTDQDTTEAAHWFAMASALGFKVAQFNLAVLYERGDGVPQDSAEAYKWYAIAAVQGDTDAQARSEILAENMDPDVLFDTQTEVFNFEPAAMDPNVNNPPDFEFPSATAQL